ncbi:poly-beta-1,6 N-acetyl-D-glucosamine export porin PgaA [Pollutimonas sp. H1-120]|uniref:poly-beta-1,6 N-acetyl-D-glucosamine export porin PgaA n=1 Tax=Pollutimonas sp. H1-120 TaxID=3148824 RepID=UPI003B5223F2
MVGGICAVSLWGVPYLAQADFSSEYDRLITRARDGDYGPALEMLRKHEPGTTSRAVYDHITIASWAGRPAEAVTAYEAIPVARTMPADALLAAARSYRDLRRWPQAIALFRKGAARYPDVTAFAAGEIMTLSDAGRVDDALQTGLARIKRHPRNPGLKLALAYVYTHDGKPYDALFHTDQAMKLAPGSRDVQREYVFALSRARLAGSALEQARKHPDLLSDIHMRGLELDAVAEQVRISAMPSRSESERFAIADRTLARYEALIEDWEKPGSDARADIIRARIDRLSALHSRVRMKDVIREYEALVAEGVVVPSYVLNDVASAYLYERHPDKARDLYRGLAQSHDTRRADTVERFNTESGLYYAYAENEQFVDADSVIDEPESRYAPWLYYKGLALPMPNDLYLQSRRLEGAARLQADDTPAAQRQLEEMVRSAPNHTGLRADLATVYRSRLLPRSSERLLKMAETLAPRSVAVETGQGFTAMDLQEWRQAEALSRDTHERYPENLNVRRLSREWEVHNKPELRVSGYRGLANDSPVYGGHDLGIDTVVYSSPIDYNWRVFGGGGYGRGTFDEGDAHYRWLRAGAQWRSRDLTVEGEVSSHNYGHGTKPGLRLAVDYDVDDRWQLGVAGEVMSRNTPLRALRSDISSNSAEAYVRWRAHEQREWRLSAAFSHFSDGNDRQGLSLQGRERLYTGPHFKLDGALEMAAQRNSGGSDVPYFNPRSDFMVLPGLRGTHTLYRHYQTVWEQIGTVAAGGYSQRGHGVGGVVALGYGQRYRRNDVLDMGVMLTGISRPYDGEREQELRIVFDLNYRF